MSYELSAQDIVLLIRERLETLDRRYFQNIMWVDSDAIKGDLRDSLDALDRAIDNINQ